MLRKKKIAEITLKQHHHHLMASKAKIYFPIPPTPAFATAC
jgi:hypothetical protein